MLGMEEEPPSHNSSTSAARRTACAIAGVNEVNCREIWKMVGLEGIEPPTERL